MDEPAPATTIHPPGVGIVRFGTFDVDLYTGELRKGGVKIKLYGQPFSVLAILLERPGQVVTRDELQRKLWAGDTFVDFEHGLNKAINKVREALGDDADNPHFIETLTRRGYRFIASVERVSAGATQPSTEKKLTNRPRWQQLLLWGVSCLAVAAVVGLAVWNLKPSPSTAKPVVRAVITLPPGQHLAGLDQPALALSPDGAKLAYVAATQDGVQRVYVRAMDSAESFPVVGTVGAVDPFFSADGQWLGFFSAGKLKKVPLKGGAVQTLTDATTVFGATWGNHHTIVFAPASSVLLEMPDGGGPAQPLTRFEPGESVQAWPEFLPGSNAVIFLGFYPATISIQPLGGGQRRDLPPAYVGNEPHYVPSGHLVYANGTNLVAAPFDLGSLQVRGIAVPVVQGVLTYQDMIAQYSLSDTGTLAYVSGGLASLASRLVWVSRDGSEQVLPAPADRYRYPRLSPDGRQIAVDISRAQSRQVWVYDLARDTLSELTSEGGTNEFAVWSPDGKRVAFTSNKQGPLRVFWQPADGSGRSERLTTSHNNSAIPFSFSADGQLLTLVEVTPPANAAKIWVLRMGDRSDEPFLQTQAIEDAPQFSPDGHWLAYATNESGRREIYVKRYPGPGGKWQISTKGGTEPVWSRDSRELFYRIGSKMMAVDIRAQPDFVAGKPRQLFEGNYVSAEGSFARPDYDVSPDGKRFLMLKPVAEEQTAPTEINVVLNWTEELKHLVPTGK